MGHPLDVDAARGDVGADEDVHLAVAEGAQRLLTGALAEVAVDRAGRETALLQLVGDVGGRALRTAEDHGQSTPVGLEDAREHLRLVHVVRTVDVLDGVLDGRALVVGRRGIDVRRLRHVAAREADDGAGHGRREQHRLALRRQHGDDALDVGQEAQVEHLVGLVQDEDADVREVELALARQVEKASRGADDHVDALLEGLDLGLVRPAAVDRENADVTDLAGGQQVVGDLLAQLTRGDDDQCLRRVRQFLGRGTAGLDVCGDGHTLQEREAETERLAGAGLGLADDVGAGERYGERHLLDGEGGHDADRLEGFGRLGKDSEVAERSQGAASSVRRGPRRTLGVVPCRGWSSGRGWAGWRGTTAVARALVPLRGPLICGRTWCTPGVEGCRVGADRATDRASSFNFALLAQQMLSKRNTTVPRIRACVLGEFIGTV